MHYMHLAVGVSFMKTYFFSCSIPQLNLEHWLNRAMDETTLLADQLYDMSPSAFSRQWSVTPQTSLSPLFTCTPKKISMGWSDFQATNWSTSVLSQEKFAPMVAHAQCGTWLRLGSLSEAGCCAASRQCNILIGCKSHNRISVTFRNYYQQQPWLSW